MGLQDVEVSYKEGDVTKTVNYEIQVNEEPTYKTYTKITSISDLHLGANYIITGVKGTDTYVMTTTQNEHNRAAETMALVDGKIVEKANTQKIQLVTGTKSNSFGLKAINGDAQGYLSAASSGSNYLHTLEELTDNGSWAITFSGANLSVKAQGSFTRNDFRFNANNNPPLFSAYGSGQTAISMWVDETSINTDTTIYDEAKAFSDWLLSVPESESCEAKFAIAQSKWEELSASAKNEFKANAEFQPAENRLLQWALANGLSSLADLDASGEGVRNPNVKSNNTLLLTITILVGVIALTTLTGIYFIKKRQTQR